MKYAAYNCECVEVEGGFEFAGACISCHRIVKVVVRKEEIEKYKQGAFIQDALTSVDADGREFLMSGYCGTCFNKLFAEEETE